MLRFEDEAVIKSVFSSYDTDTKGYLSFKQFTALLTRLAKHVPELKGIELEAAQSTFALFNRNADGKLQYAEFRGWWLKEDKYSYLVGERAKLVHNAYNLYKRYTSTSTGEGSTSTSTTALSLDKFLAMMEDLGITCTADNFDQLDINGDGLLSFEEFSRWLKWF